MTEVKFYNPSFEPESGLIYSVIAARYRKKWIYVRHRDRNTWEIPGGHIEDNETPDQAASRELMEETGAQEFSIECVATYSVLQDGRTGYGRLYLADVKLIGPVPDVSEIAEIKIMEGLPGNLTYPYIQTRLFEKINSHLEK
jgi:8-oxo-dGTP diphosphatase